METSKNRGGFRMLEIDAGTQRRQDANVLHVVVEQRHHLLARKRHVGNLSLSAPSKQDHHAVDTTVVVVLEIGVRSDKQSTQSARMVVGAPNHLVHTLEVQGDSRGIHSI